MPSLPWQVPQVLGIFSGYTADRESVFGKNRVRISVATRAGMVLRIRMHASRQRLRLVRVAGLALHLRHLVRMRIFLDVRVAIVAFQAAVNAVAERLSVHRDAVPVGILHRLVSVAGQAIRLRVQPDGRHRQQQRGQPLL